jgi:hypothetical protein
MLAVPDLTNQKFGRLTVIGQGAHIGKAKAWNCICDCGNTKLVQTGNLRSGTTVSCGCFKHEQNKAQKSNTRHGKVKSSTYVSWQAMKTRCTNPKYKQYYNYGGRGISFPESWTEFKNFLADMGEKPVGYTLERIDNNKGYSKENCKWASRQEQATNTRTAKRLTYNNKTMCMLDWSRELKIPYDQIKNGFHKGLSAEQILGA